MVLAIVLLTGVNWLGVREGAMVQNAATVLKVTALAGASPLRRGATRRAAISRYSALAGSTTSHGIPALAAASSMARTVCDLPEPAAP